MRAAVVGLLLLGCHARAPAQPSGYPPLDDAQVRAIAQRVAAVRELEPLSSLPIHRLDEGAMAKAVAGGHDEGAPDTGFIMAFGMAEQARTASKMDAVL